MEIFWVEFLSLISKGDEQNTLYWMGLYVDLYGRRVK
jgi:hypothetical protein